MSNLKKTDKKSIKRNSNGRPVFSEFTLTPTRTTENTVEKETVRIADKLAPVFRHLKQKTTDHIDEELSLEIFKAEVFPTIFFFFLLC